MKIKLKDAMKIAEKMIAKERKLDDAFRRMEEENKFLRERMYDLEKQVYRLEMKVAEMNGEVNEAETCEKYCTPNRY